MNTPTQFSIGNAALRNKEYEIAISLYEQSIIHASQPVRLLIRFNLELAALRLRSQKSSNKDTSITNLRSILKIIDDVKKIRPHFHESFYLSSNLDVASSGTDPVEHYCTVGWKQGRDPHPNFSTFWYLTVNSDVREAGCNPFIHWLFYGHSENREAKPSAGWRPPNAIANPGLFKNVETLPNIQDSVDIIVPIYNAYDYLSKCLNRLFRYTEIIHRVILIDDASTDTRIHALCADFLAKRPGSVLLKNASNLGFIATVNRGFLLARSHVVLINTDAFVPEGWLERLLAPLFLDPSVASVTPMTNNGEIANVPVMCSGAVLSQGQAEIIDQVARSFDPLRTLYEIPTGVGFCMAMSRHWLDKVPNFDTTFGRGYGEEVDWCLRVLQLDGKHLLTGALFVEHHGGVSFGSEKQAQITINNKIISQRYPDYDRCVQRFIEGDPAIAPRLALGFALLSTEAEIPIYLGHRLGGGAEMWLEDQVLQRLEKHLSTLIVREGDIIDTALIELHTTAGVTKGNISLYELEKYLEIIPNIELIYSCLVASKDPIQLINVLIKNLSTTDRLRFVFHDFFPLCTSYNLIGHDGKYCSLPGASECESCYQRIKVKTGNISDTNQDWRKKWKTLLDRANNIEVFSLSSKEIVCTVWPDLNTKITINPHRMSHLPKKIKKNKHDRIVMGVLGSIGYQKGAGILSDLACVIDDRMKIVLIGEIDPKFAHPKVHVHGRFLRSEISQLAEQYSINCWLMPSIWPETFSYVTRECIATELPVYAFDLGAQAEALRDYPKGVLMPLATTAQNIFDMVIEIQLINAETYPVVIS